MTNTKKSPPSPFSMTGITGIILNIKIKTWGWWPQEVGQSRCNRPHLPRHASRLPPSGFNFSFLKILWIFFEFWCCLWWTHTHLVVKDGVHKYCYAVLGQDLKTYWGESFLRYSFRFVENFIFRIFWCYGDFGRGIFMLLIQIWRLKKSEWAHFRIQRNKFRMSGLPYWPISFQGKLKSSHFFYFHQNMLVILCTSVVFSRFIKFGMV